MPHADRSWLMMVMTVAALALFDSANTLNSKKRDCGHDLVSGGQKFRDIRWR